MIGRAMRISVSGWSTTAADVDATLASILRAEAADGEPAQGDPRPAPRGVV